MSEPVAPRPEEIRAAIRPLHIAIVSEVLPGPGRTGAAYANHRLANELVLRGHDVCVVSMDPPPEDARYRSHRIIRPDRLVYLRFARSLRSVDWSPFDVVLTTGIDALLRRSGSFAWVRLFHGSSFDEAIHAADARFRAQMLLAGLADTVTMVRADLTVAVSENTRRWHRRIDRLAPNAVDRSVFHPGVKSTEPSILFVGSLGGRKCGTLLRDAFQELVRPVHPTAELRLVLAERGVVPLPGERIFHAVPEEELAELYRTSWLYGSAASYEGFGIPYIEAMASGTPVVTTENRGAVELARQCGSIETVPVASIGSVMADRLRRPDLLRAMGDRARHESERFGWPAVVDVFEAAFLTAIDRR